MHWECRELSLFWRDHIEGKTRSSEDRRQRVPAGRIDRHLDECADCRESYFDEVWDCLLAEQRSQQALGEQRPEEIRRVWRILQEVMRKREANAFGRCAA